jgi:hypothetical protein
VAASRPDRRGPRGRALVPPDGGRGAGRLGGFLTDLTERYSDRAAALEIWNEPNERWFWKPAPDPAAYAALLRAAYLAVKAVAPQLTVTSGGLSHNDAGFLTRFYDAAETLPDAAANRYFFDQLGLHPYTGDRSPDLVTDRARYQGTFGPVDENFLGMREMVELTAAREGTAKRVWISEFGYPTEATEWFAGTPDPRRAYFLSRAFALVRASGYVDGLGWYHSHPTPWDPPVYDLLTAQGETETFAQLTRETGARPATAGLVPPVRATTTGTVQVSGNRVGLRQAPARMELYVDGVLVASGTRSLAWDSRTVSGGPHRVQLVAWSAGGTTHTSAVQDTVVSN